LGSRELLEKLYISAGWFIYGFPFLIFYPNCGCVDGVRQSVGTVDFPTYRSMHIVPLFMLAVNVQMVADNFDLHK
jgi:hypothetical protein